MLNEPHLLIEYSSFWPYAYQVKIEFGEALFIDTRLHFKNGDLRKGLITKTLLNLLKLKKV